MALLQHSAACIRGLVPLTRAAAASGRSSGQLLKCTNLLIRGSFDGVANHRLFAAKRDESGLILDSGGSRSSTETADNASTLRSRGGDGPASGSDLLEVRVERSISLPEEGAKSKSIVDIYGPYEPPSGTQNPHPQEFGTDQRVSSTGGLQDLNGVQPTEIAIRTASRQEPVNMIKPAVPSLARFAPSISDDADQTNMAATIVQLQTAEVASNRTPRSERFPSELTDTNVTATIGIAEPLAGMSNSDNGAYAAFSAFAVVPLLLVLVVSWLTYSSYRSKRRPLEIKVGGQGGAASGDLESGNGKSKGTHSTLVQQIVERLLQLREEYNPFPGLTNAHVETIFAAFFRRLPDVRFRRECLAAPDGGTVALDWPVHGGKRASDDAMWSQELPAGSPVLILLPGLTGGSGDTYVCHMLVRARRAGFHTVVFNSRGCADSPVTSPQFYSASFTDDMRMVAAHVQQRFPDSKLLAMGWSLGANILVRYLGQEESRTPVAAAVSLCNPFDLVKGDEGFRKGMGKVYDQSLAKSLNRIFTKHAPLFEGIGGDYDIPLVATAKTVRDFDEGLTRVCFGFPSVDEYYRQSSSINNIQDVAVPLMCIQAEDDPIAPNDGIPRKKIMENPNTFLVVTPGGGHLGWIAGDEAPLGAPWTDPLVMDFFNAFLELQPEGRRRSSSAQQEVRQTIQEVEKKASPGKELEVSWSWNKRR